MTKSSFYLHEDDWAMIDILPAENLVRTQAVAAEAQQFGQKHFDGVGWTQMYVIPEQPYPISIRRILVSEVKELFTGCLGFVEQLTTGYSSYRETVKDGFALVSKECGVIYGQHKEGFITGLHVAQVAGDRVEGIEQFIGKMVELGSRHNLILADWWSDKVVDLRVEKEVRNYIFGQDADEHATK